ncbi:MAG: glycine cleavage system aminomethyltransferase GcvT [Planctomycetota bacterium]
MIVLEHSRLTVLHPCHLSLGARMLDFAGWQMPVQYRGILEEHAACREGAAAFDISHMGEIEIRGADVRASLDRVLSNDISKAPDGAARYGFILNDEGGIIDDVIALVVGPSRAIVVVNAANTERDLRWIGDHVPPGSEVIDRSDALAKIDVQGPGSRDVTSRVVDQDLSGLAYFRLVETSWMGEPLLLSRTGYTGELGYELFVGTGRAVDLWKAILEAGAVPAGLGARDTLRLEAGLPLYGHELNDDTSPAEAGCMKYVGMEKPADFPGREALRAAGAPSRRLVGLEMLERGVPREGYAVEVGSARVGTVTSGTVSPALGKGIAMAYVASDAAEAGRRLDVIIRGRPVPCAVVEVPFYRNALARR